MTFASLFAQPGQALLCSLRRRLLRLLDRIDQADGADPVIAREHVLARLADLMYAATALLRLLRP